MRVSGSSEKLKTFVRDSTIGHIKKDEVVEVSCDCVEYTVICHVRDSKAGKVWEAREAGTQRVLQVLAAGDLCILPQAEP